MGVIKPQAMWAFEFEPQVRSTLDYTKLIGSLYLTFHTFNVNLDE